MITRPAKILRLVVGVIAALLMLPGASAIEPLTIQGQNFVTTNGTPVRFWGVNLVSLYPTHGESVNLASNLDALGVNLVRLHHDLRNSTDWNTVSGIGALASYVSNSRDPNTNAWERFDYLNAQLRNHNIYLTLSLHGTRRFQPGDVDILTTNPGDRTNWMNAITALNSQNAPDLIKLLPVMDERAARLMIEFATNLVTHVNPYTGLAYGSDPQVLYIETLNECSAEYTIVAGNQFPAGSYFDTLLQSNWNAYCTAHGIAFTNIYSGGTTTQRLARGDFLRGLDLAFYDRIKTAVRATGCQKPMEFSNLWRGEAFQKMSAGTNDVIEDHQYQYPRLTGSFDDLFRYTTWSCVTGKPYFVGELNQSLSDTQIATNAPYRTMLELASGAYGSFNDWSGVIWFAWEHGDRMLGYDGWSLMEERTPHVPDDMIGEIHSDGMMLDHFRTAGLMFRQGYVAKSTSNIVLFVDDPLGATSYPSLIAPKYDIRPGWQDIHAIRRAFGPVPAGQSTAPFMTTTPGNPLVSNTGQIRKDTTRGQLTVAAPKAEGFSGTIDGAAPAGLACLQPGGTVGGSATLILVSNDGNDLTNSADLLLSQTYLDPNNQELTNATTVINQLTVPSAGMAWFIQRTRPRGQTGYQQLSMTTPGQLVLPSDPWHECELRLAPVGSLPPVQSTAHTGDVIRAIFKDTFLASGQSGTYSLGVGTQGVIDQSGANGGVLSAEGSALLRLKFTGGLTVARIAIVFLDDLFKIPPVDFTGITNFAGLHFWVYPKAATPGGPTFVPSFSVELLCTNSAGQLIETSVPLTNYLSAADYTNAWKEVIVPFSDFPNTGFYYSGGATNFTPFLWNKVAGVGFYCSTVTSGFYDPRVDDIDVVYASIPPPTGGGSASDPFTTWQFQYFGSTNCALCGGDADFDGDGISNTNEFLAGSSPTNSASALRITAVATQGNDVIVSWQTFGGKTNALQAASDNPGNFTDISPPIIITGLGDATTNAADFGGATNAPSRFYRVRVVP